MLTSMAFAMCSAGSELDLGVEEMQTLFILEGSVQYIDDEDNLIYQDDVFSKLERYTKFCEEQGIEPLDLRY